MGRQEMNLLQWAQSGHSGLAKGKTQQPVGGDFEMVGAIGDVAQALLPQDVAERTGRKLSLTTSTRRFAPQQIPQGAKPGSSRMPSRCCVREGHCAAQNANCPSRQARAPIRPAAQSSSQRARQRSSMRIFMMPQGRRRGYRVMKSMNTR